eukprot:1449166-Pleurochrysis_carterae.AAC.3
MRRADRADACDGAGDCDGDGKRDEKCRADSLDAPHAAQPSRDEQWEGIRDEDGAERGHEPHDVGEEGDEVGEGEGAAYDEESAEGPPCAIGAAHADRGAVALRRR